MMSEINLKETSEIKRSSLDSYKEIKAPSTTYNESKEYWNDTFAKKEYFDDNGEKYREENQLEPNNKFEKNGYTYETDDAGRVISVEGELQVKDHNGRYKMPDSREVVGKGEMAASDDRGHLIADMFNGSGELENLVPMEGKLNKGDYAKLEKTLSYAVNDGAEVYLKVEPIYDSDSNRPAEIKVTHTIDGDKEIVVFKNRSGD